LNSVSGLLKNLHYYCTVYVNVGFFITEAFLRIYIWFRGWEDNIRMDLREMAWEVVDWMLLAQDRDQWWALVNTIMNLLVQ
jgi:hypothetical protein